MYTETAHWVWENTCRVCLRSRLTTEPQDFSFFLKICGSVVRHLLHFIGPAHYRGQEFTPSSHYGREFQIVFSDPVGRLSIHGKNNHWKQSSDFYISNYNLFNIKFTLTRQAILMGSAPGPVGNCQEQCVQSGSKYFMGGRAVSLRHGIADCFLRPSGPPQHTW